MVETINLECKKTSNLWVLNDVHFGAKACRIDKFKERIEKIKKDKNAIVILNGDLLEAIHFNDPRFDIDSVDPKYNTVNKQYVGMRKILEPIKNKIVAVGDGNHEYKIKKYSGMDISRLYAEEFNAIYYGDALIIKLTIAKKEYNCLIIHGGSGSTTMTGNIGAIKKYADNMETTPDVVIMGHVHRLDLIHNPKLSNDFETKMTAREKEEWLDKVNSVRSEQVK